jgi:hypothetical protein
MSTIYIENLVTNINNNYANNNKGPMMMTNSRPIPIPQPPRYVRVTAQQSVGSSNSSPSSLPRPTPPTPVGPSTSPLYYYYNPGKSQNNDHCKNKNNNNNNKKANNDVWLRVAETSGDLITGHIVSTPPHTKRYRKGDRLIFTHDKIQEGVNVTPP